MKTLVAALLFVSVVIAMGAAPATESAPPQVMTNYLCAGYPTDMYGRQQDPFYYSAIFRGPNETGSGQSYAANFESYVKRAYRITYFKAPGCWSDYDRQKLQSLLDGASAGSVFTNWTPASK